MRPVLPYAWHCDHPRRPILRRVRHRAFDVGVVWELEKFLEWCIAPRPQLAHDLKAAVIKHVPSIGERDPSGFTRRAAAH
eukprot:scaffold256739_cov31-Tisochrysis_lutea.AAC.3